MHAELAPSVQQNPGGGNPVGGRPMWLHSTSPYNIRGDAAANAPGSVTTGTRRSAGRRSRNDGTRGELAAPIGEHRNAGSNRAVENGLSIVIADRRAVESRIRVAEPDVDRLLCPYLPPLDGFVLTWHGCSRSVHSLQVLSPPRLTGTPVYARVHRKVKPDYLPVKRSTSIRRRRHRRKYSISKIQPHQYLP